MKNKNSYMRVCVALEIIISVLCHTSEAADTGYGEKTEGASQKSESESFRDDVYAFTKVRNITNKDEAIKFDEDFKSLFDAFYPGKQDQSDAFWDQLLKFCKKYNHKFPIGRIEKTTLSDIHVGPNCKNQCYTETTIKVSRKLDFLCNSIIEKMMFYGAGRGAAEQEKADALFSLYCSLYQERVDAIFYKDPVIDLESRSKTSSYCARKIKQFYSEKGKKKSSHLSHGDMNLIVDIACIEVLMQRFIYGGGDENFQMLSKRITKLIELENPMPPDQGYRFVRNLWIFKNYSTKTGDKGSLNYVENILKKISEHGKSEEIRRWALEALAKENYQASIPKRLFIGNIIRDSKNKIIGVDENGDGKSDHPYDPKDYE